MCVQYVCAMCVCNVCIKYSTIDSVCAVCACVCVCVRVSVCKCIHIYNGVCAILFAHTPPPHRVDLAFPVALAVCVCVGSGGLSRFLLCVYMYVCVYICIYIYLYTYIDI